MTGSGMPATTSSGMPVLHGIHISTRITCCAVGVDIGETDVGRDPEETAPTTVTSLSDLP